MRGFGHATDIEILYTLAINIEKRFDTIALYNDNQITLKNKIFQQLDCIIHNLSVNVCHPKVVDTLKKYSPKQEAWLLAQLGFADTANLLFDLYDITFIVVKN